MKIGVLTVSDSVSKGNAVDRSGPLIIDILSKNQTQLVAQFPPDSNNNNNALHFTAKVVPDEGDQITEVLMDWCSKDLHLIITTGISFSS